MKCLQQAIFENQVRHTRRRFYQRLLVQIRLRRFCYEDHDVAHGTCQLRKAERLIGRCLTALAECRGRLA